MRYLFILPEQIGPECIELDREQEHRLRRVLRLSHGDRLMIRIRGGRSVLWTRVVSFKKGRIRLVLDEDDGRGIESPAESVPARRGVNLALSLLKGSSFERVFKASVELGVETFTPLASINCVVPRLSDRERDRLIKIGDEACQQCGRYELPRLLDEARPETYVQQQRALDNDVLMFHETVLDQPPACSGDRVQDDARRGVAVMIGPEGGWDPGEVAACERQGARVVRVPGHVLRAETAALSFTALVVFRGVEL